MFKFLSSVSLLHFAYLAEFMIQKVQEVINLGVAGETEQKQCVFTFSLYPNIFSYA